MRDSWVIRTLFFGAIFVLFTHSTAYSQPKPGSAPSSTHIYPAGAQRGTSVDVSIGGECLPPGAWFSVFWARRASLARAESVKVERPRVDRKTHEACRRTRLSRRRGGNRRKKPITYPKEWASRIAVDKSAQPGIVRWRLSCVQGGTVTRPFVIGELPEFLESESNSTIETANAVSLPVTVNGRIHGERDLDHFRFAAKPGQVVVCEVLAARLQSRLDPIITILDADGQPVATETIYVKNDPVIAFRATSAADYVLRIGNVSHHGDAAHVYRINISTKPFVRSTFPTGGTAGKQQTIEFRLMNGTNQPLIVKREIPYPKTIPLSGQISVPIAAPGSGCGQRGHA